MDKKYYALIAVAAIIGIVIYLVHRNTITPPAAADEQEPVKCLNKTVFRYKHPGEMFPVITRDYSNNFNTAVKVLNKLADDSAGDASVSDDVSNQAKQLRQTLDQDNIFFENMLKGYFYALNDDPCNDSLRFRYTSYITEMTEKQIQLKQFIAQVSVPQKEVSHADTINKGDILAVIDTSVHKDSAAASNIPPPPSGVGSKLYVLKDFSKLSSAFKSLSNNYIISKKEMTAKPNH